IAGLVKKRERLRQQIAKQDADIASEPNEQFRQKLRDEQAALQEQLNTLEQTLKEMNYTAAQPPDLDKPAQLASLRQWRDPNVFKDWKRSTYATIRRLRGALPWLDAE